MRVLHFDHLLVHLDRSSMSTNVDGSRTIEGIGAHVGPYTYHDDQGRPFIENVPAETLFDPVSLDSAAGTTLTIRHGPGLVTPERFRAEAHGTWVRAWDAGDGNLGVKVRVASREGLDFVDEALAKGDAVELSPVYEVDVVGTPGNLTQKDRDYSGIAMLGPQEARGGPDTKLKLDGPVCAPAGARVQVRGSRLDSVAHAALHSVPTGCSTMKHATISSNVCKGRRRLISLDKLECLRGLRVDAKKSDQIAVGRVLVEIEGEEPVDLMLPVAMIEMLLEGIGAGPSEPPAAEVDPAAEEVVVESLDAEEDEEKIDSKTVRKMIADALDVRDRKHQRATSRASSVHGDARTILPPGYDFSVDWTEVCVDAIAKADPDAETRATALASKALHGDSVAEGRLREMLSERAARATSTTSTTTIVNVDGPEKRGWESDEMPGSESP